MQENVICSPGDKADKQIIHKIRQIPHSYQMLTNKITICPVTWLTNRMT